MCANLDIIKASSPDIENAYVLLFAINFSVDVQNDVD
jgi:hypothetical protein